MRGFLYESLSNKSQDELQMQLAARLKVRYDMSPGKIGKGVYLSTVPQTDTGELVEYTKAYE